MEVQAATNGQMFNLSSGKYRLEIKTFYFSGNGFELPSG